MHWIISLLLIATAVPGLYGDDLAFADAEVQITLDISQSHAHHGDNITLACRVENMPENAYVNWAKAIWIDSETRSEIIANDDILNPPYQRFPNYRMTTEKSNNVKHYTLHINNVALQETGEYICSYLDMQDSVFGTETFEVYDYVDYINVYLNATSDEESENGVIEADVNEAVYLKFEAGDSIPAANLHMFLGETEVTDKFTFQHESDPQCTSATIGKNCAIHHTMRTLYESHIVKFQPEHRDMGLMVSAVVPGSGFEPFNRTFELAINYPPQFKCLVDWYVRPGSEFILACKVRAYPLSDMFYWMIPEGDGSITLDAWKSTTYQNYTTNSELLSEDDGEEENTHLVTLHISYVTEHNFQKYYLKAGNDMGNNTLEMEIFEDTSPDDEGNAAFLTVNVSLLCAMVVLLRMWLD